MLLLLFKTIKIFVILVVLILAFLLFSTLEKIYDNNVSLIVKIICTLFEIFIALFFFGIVFLALFSLIFL